MKKGCVQTSVLIPMRLYKEYKKQKLNLSNFVTEMLEYELYHENSDFIKTKLEELDKHHAKEHDLLTAKLKVAREKQEEKKERIEKFKPETRRNYGAIIEGDD